MAGLCPQLSCVFVVVTSLQLLHVQGSLTVTGVHHPVTQVACRYPRKDLFILTLKQTGNTSSVRSADIMDTCSGDMMFSACTFDDTCVTVKALVVGQGSEEFRVFECKATLKVNSESREIPVGQINITVGGLTAPPHTTASLGVMEATGGLRQPVFTGTCVSRDAQPTVIIALVVLLVVVIVINAVLVVVILKLRGLGRSHVTEGTTSLTPCAADPPPTASVL
ncbi:uncharacterized protein LOC112568179 isoform X2 [Pomacea canaliculata]|uniref:uncharacterized protein LOC112568179 isoform X2 n=1 Tax=Pomacea canaliculata TaxID=400727 RepID=UPI000D7280B3|nr:uncharacterized protein LOC112568179 isoform X2 [Pomacea canaliculata]